MKIALIANPWIQIPPSGYGGTERVVHLLAEGLKKNGHDVTLFSTGDSQVSVDLRYYYKEALGNSKDLKNNPEYLFKHLEYVFSMLGTEYDMVHYHGNRAGWEYLSKYQKPFVITYHAPFRSDEFTLKYQDLPFVSISNTQRFAAPGLTFVATVYNGVDISHLPFSNGGDKMIFLSRFSSIKGADTVAEIAKLLKRKAILGGSIDDGEAEYFQNTLLGEANNPYVEIQYDKKDIVQKSTFYAQGKVFVFPIRWEEPFGLVMAESMACGTPVVAYDRGAVPEIVRDGKTGFIINQSVEEQRGEFLIKKTGIEGLCEAVDTIYYMSDSEYTELRNNSRKHVEDHFSSEKMVTGYENVYKQLIENWGK